MRILLSAGMFLTVAAVTYALFENALYAIVAGAVLAGAGKALVWSEPDKR